MAGQFEWQFVVTAIGANSATLTPLLGEGPSSSGVAGTGTLEVSRPDMVGGLSSIVVNFSGTPDSTKFRHVGQRVTVELEFGN